MKGSRFEKGLSRLSLDLDKPTYHIAFIIKIGGGTGPAMPRQPLETRVPNPAAIMPRD